MSAGTTPGPVVVCKNCDAVYRRQPLPRLSRARCLRCHGELYRERREGFDDTIALAAAGLIAFIIANVYPVMSINIQGSSNTATLWQTMLAPERYGLGAVSVLVAVMVFFTPMLQLLLTLYVAIPLHLRHRPPGFATVMHALRYLRPWSMVEVFLLGALVAVAKLAGLASVAPGIGLWGFVGLTVLMTLLLLDDPHRFWDAADTCVDGFGDASARTT